MRIATTLQGHVSALLPWALCAAFLVAMMASFLSHPKTLMAQESDTPEVVHQSDLSPLRTDSPRDLLATFLAVRDDMESSLVAYTTENSVEGAMRLALLSDQMVSLFDLALVPAVERRETGIETATYLMDIFGRIDPELGSVPDLDGLESDASDSFRIAGTPIRIVRMTDGDREGEFLFSGTTVQTAPRFLRGLMDIPLRTELDAPSYTALSPQLTGPLIPASIVRNMPPSLRTLWLGTPLWKALAVSFAVAVFIIVVARLQRWLMAHSPGGRISSLLLRSLLPLAILAGVSFALPYFSGQVNISGEFASIVEKVRSVAAHAAYAWLFWIGVRLAFEWIIRSPQIQDESLDANLLRLVSGMIGMIGVVVILAFGGQAIGLPILSVLAGLGIGGLAVALALRPTLENLVGGVILYIDRPVRVGDFCSFEGQMGSVEGIGVRSTKLRAPDRTLITVPNAQFADMQIVNFAFCDQMLVHETIGVRYETEPDQLRYLLAEMRKMLIAHPKIDSETVRVRFSGYGSSALNIDVRIYIMTQDWSEFFAVREDAFLRIHDLVTETGTDFAFPSQTVYLARDAGIDTKRGDTAKAKVAGWRRSGELPFPYLPRDTIEGLEGTLEYPPRGSSRSEAEHMEPLAQAQEPEVPDGSESIEDDERRREETTRKP